MNAINIMKVEWNLQAVDKLYIAYDNGKGWVASVTYYINGLKIEKDFYDRKATLEEKLKEVKLFLESV